MLAGAVAGCGGVTAGGGIGGMFVWGRIGATGAAGAAGAAGGSGSSGSG
jgi:hypothetical protein